MEIRNAPVVAEGRIQTAIAIEPRQHHKELAVRRVELIPQN